MLTVGKEAKLIEAAVLRVVPEMEKKELGFEARLKDMVAPVSGSVADNVPTTAFTVPSCITIRENTERR
jgi:hypothetical protein